MKKTKKILRKRNNKHKRGKKSHIRKIKNMKGGSIKAFIHNQKEDNESIVLIGSGAHGDVFYDKNQKDIVFKVSNEANTCRDWKKEVEIYQKLSKYNIDEDLCKLLKMIEFQTFESNCYLELIQMHNPLNIDADYTIQPYFGSDSANDNFDGRGEKAHIKKRGLFLGIKQLIENGFFTENSMKKYIKDLAIVMARLHYQIKNDGYDIELFLDKNNDKITVYIGDFDLTNFYEEIDDIVIQKLVDCFMSLPYFPSSAQPELFNIFSENYITESKKFDHESIAKKVIDLYK